MDTIAFEVLMETRGTVARGVIVGTFPVEKQIGSSRYVRVFVQSLEQAGFRVRQLSAEETEKAADRMNVL